MGNFFAELKRRQMFRVAAAYAVVAWLLIQLVNNITPMLNLPAWVGTVVLVLLLVGFPVAILFAWIQQLAAADGAAAPIPTTKLDYVLVGTLIVVIVLVSYQQLAPGSGERTAQQKLSLGASNASPAQLAAISIAVLPFANLSGDAGQEFFSDGMTEEITAALAKVPNLRVVARTSAFEFKGQNRNVQAIGQSLNASHVIEGSVRREGDRVRITAQLIQADNGLTVWTENYDRQLTGVFATQEDIAQAIAGALRVPLGLRQGESLVSNRTDDLESYQQYLRARALYRARAVGQAVALLEPAVARDPSYAPAWALRAQARILVPTFETRLYAMSVDDARRLRLTTADDVEMAAREAIRLDPRHAGGYAALANLEASRRNWAESDDLFRQALALDPDEPDVLQSHSLTLASAGRIKDALSERERLSTLEPFVPVYNIFNAHLLQLSGQNEASIPLLEAIPQGGAVNFYRNVYLAQGYAAAGRYGEAAETLLAIPATAPQVTRRSVEDAARLLRGAPARASMPETLPALERELNFVYGHIGAQNRLLEAPDRAIDLVFANSTPMVQLWHPMHASLRKTEGFKALVRKAGLVDYWRERGWPDLCRPMGADDFECD